MRLYRDLGAEEYAKLVCERLPLALQDGPAFRELVAAGLRFRGDQQVENRLKLLDGLSFFSLAMFEALISGGAPYKSGPVNYLWECLERSGVVVATMGSFDTGYATHSLNKPQLKNLVDTRTLPNVFRPPSDLPNYYGGALMAVDVVKRGDPYRGSGFLTYTAIGPSVLTCKHNIDPADGITEHVVTDAEGRTVRCDAPILSEALDVAVLPLAEPLGERIPICLTLDVETFDEVFTLGFPQVPGALPTLVGHRGEVNGRAQIYLDRSPALLISNIVSPGSSGCPVLTPYGLCVGMTTRWLEAEAAQGGARFSAALPSDALLTFLRSLGQT